jgi:hypothetical protein
MKNVIFWDVSGVVRYKLTDVLEERTASTFHVGHEGNTFLRNVCELPSSYMISLATSQKQYSSHILVLYSLLVSINWPLVS